MAVLVLGLVVFLALHSLRIFAEDWRGQMISRMGDKPWKGIISVLSLASFVIIMMGYGMARQSPIAVWSPPFWMSHVVSLLMLPAFVLMLAAYVPSNSIRSRLGHPMVISVKLWAASHLLANGNLADIVLFGAFLVWAVMSFRAARRRDRRDDVRRPPGRLLPTLVTIVFGALVWAWFILQGHAWLIGVQPLIVRG
jgi:uncharacterized membrane protein